MTRTVRRFQAVKIDQGWSWAEKGPDLLRTRESAVGFLDAMPESEWWDRRMDEHGDWTAPEGPLTRDQALHRADTWNPDFDKQVLQFGRKDDDRFEARWALKGHEIVVQDLPRARDRAELAWALYDRMFPETDFGGVFVCKPYSHGYGDAADVSHGNTPKVFDWGLRMSKEGLLACEQIIGTQDVKTEVQAWARDGFAVKPYDGDGSHLWHVHHGCGHATDEHPPC
jgi:hypothetical protein